MRNLQKILFFLVGIIILTINSTKAFEISISNNFHGDVKIVLTTQDVTRKFKKTSNPNLIEFSVKRGKTVSYEIPNSYLLNVAYRNQTYKPKTDRKQGFYRSYQIKVTNGRNLFVTEKSMPEE